MTIAIISVVAIILAGFAWWNYRHGKLKQENNGLKVADILHRKNEDQLKQYIRDTEKISAEGRVLEDENKKIFSGHPRVVDIVSLLDRARGVSKNSKAGENKPAGKLRTIRLPRR